MGYVPIFLYLGGFVFLFVLVVANNIKNKRMLYQKSFDLLVSNLKEITGAAASKQSGWENKNLAEIERFYQSLKVNADEDLLSLLKQKVRPSLAQAKLHLYWYNKLVRQKPYSFVARLIGYSPV